MKGTRYTEEQIVRILGDVERGRSVAKTARQYGVSESTIHRWWKEFERMEISGVRRLRELETENVRLRRIVAQQVKQYADRIELPENGVGVVVAVNGKMEMADVFDKPDTLQRLWGKLVRGYAVGALDRRGEKTTRKKPAPESARQFLRRASRASMERYDAPGVGEDVRIRRGGSRGGCVGL